MAITSLRRYATEPAASFPSRIAVLWVILFAPRTASIVLFIGCGSEQQWLASPRGVIDVTVEFSADAYKHFLCRSTAILRGGNPWKPFALTRASRSAISWSRPISVFSPQIEVVCIPFDGARLPGYFLSAGQPKRPTLLVLNGGDSTNEEMVHWLGFAAVARGWNCMTFEEGPGQWSAPRIFDALLQTPSY
jgi:hypothetical protein